MTQERWQEIIGQIKDNFELIDQKNTELPEEEGPGSIETVEFKGPLGLMRLEYITQPLVLDKKTIGSRRIGSDVKVEYVYSDTETVNKFKAYKFDESSQDWVELKLEKGDDMIF